MEREKMKIRGETATWMHEFGKPAHILYDSPDSINGLYEMNFNIPQVVYWPDALLAQADILHPSLTDGNMQ